MFQSVMMFSRSSEAALDEALIKNIWMEEIEGIMHMYGSELLHLVRLM